MSNRIQYFSRCNNQPVRLAHVNYGARAIQLRLVAYPGQSQFVRDSRSQTTCTLAAALASRHADYFAIGVCETCGLTHAADRIIDRGLAPSGHACDARCRFAKGHQCECACGGRWHGAGNTHPDQTTLFAAPAAELLQLLDGAGDAPTDLWRF